MCAIIERYTCFNFPLKSIRFSLEDYSYHYHHDGNYGKDQKRSVYLSSFPGRCKIISLYHASQKEVITLPSLEANVPPWSAVFDPEGRLWCVQPYPEEPVLVFEPSGHSPDLTVCDTEIDFRALFD